MTRIAAILSNVQLSEQKLKAINKIKHYVPELQTLPDAVVAYQWGDWSEYAKGSEWTAVIPDMIEEFKRFLNEELGPQEFMP